jgi:hypothetical protein
VRGDDRDGDACAFLGTELTSLKAAWSGGEDEIGRGEGRGGEMGGGREEEGWMRRREEDHGGLLFEWGEEGCVRIWRGSLVSSLLCVFVCVCVWLCEVTGLGADICHSLLCRC